MAGVSHQTVSRVLNEHRSVRPETRGRVLAAIDEIGYRRNSVARALVTRRSGAIGVVTSRSALYGPTSVLLGVEAAARDTGYFVSLVSLPDLNEQAMRAALDHFADQAVEGVMVIGASADFVAAALSAQPRFPMVTISAMTDRREGVHVATVDHYQGAAMLMRHLFDLGHRDIAHVRGPLDSLDGSARVRAWSDALQARGITVQPSRLLLGDWSAESGYAAGRSLLADPAGLPTAVFSGNDEMALGLLRALSEAGVEVPAQVSVVGFDDIPGAAYFAPPLTTIRQEFDVLGAEGIRLLAAAISGLATPEPILVPPTLLVRASTAPPR